MKATTLVLSQHRRIQKLVDAAAYDAAKRDVRTHALIEAIVTHLATEETILYPEIERTLALDLREHRAGHVRARLALFRVATSPTRTDAFCTHLSRLDHVLRDHALRESGTVRTLEDSMSDGVLRRIGKKMVEFQRALTARPAFTRRFETALAS
jgi:hypothetical protein